MPKEQKTRLNEYVVAFIRLAHASEFLVVESARGGDTQSWMEPEWNVDSQGMIQRLI
jgi:hypothetical protein